jgi:hypothetical protein
LAVVRRPGRNARARNLARIHWSTWSVHEIGSRQRSAALTTTARAIPTEGARASSGRSSTCTLSSRNYAGGASLNDGEARSRENPRIATCYDKLSCVCIATIIAKAQLPICYPPQLPITGFDENKLALSGCPSPSFGSGNWRTFSSGIGGRGSVYVIAANCDGHWITAGKRQFERLVEKGVNPMVFLTFRSRSFRV